MTSLRDALFAFAFADETKAIALLHRLLPPELTRIPDWSTLRRLTAPRPAHPVRRTPGDVLFACQLRDGRQLLLYCALQHSSQHWRFELTDMLDRVTSALRQRDQPDVAGRDLPHVLPLLVHVGTRPFALPAPLAELFADACMPGTPTRFALLFEEVINAHRLHYHALAGRTLSPAELFCLTAMRCWRELAKSPAEMRRCVEVWRDVLDEVSAITATTPADGSDQKSAANV